MIYSHLSAGYRLDETVSEKNYNLMNQVSVFGATIVGMCFIQLVNQIGFFSERITLWGSILWMLVLPTLVILINQKESSFMDIASYLTFINFAGLLLFQFLQVHRKNVLANITQNIQVFEYEQYRDMFNSLQEGILVFDNNDEGCSTFFANELMLHMMGHVLKQDPKQQRGFDFIKSHMTSAVFHQYRSEFTKQQRRESESDVS